MDVGHDTTKTLLAEPPERPGASFCGPKEGTTGLGLRSELRSPGVWTGLVVRIAAITWVAEPDQDHIARFLAPVAHHVRIGVIEQDCLALHPQQFLIGHLDGELPLGKG